MEDKVDLSAADKAQLVWEATWKGEREPLDDETAAALGVDLEWAACFRTVADSPLPPRTGSRIKQIEAKARGLERLLASNPAACCMIEHFWPDFLEANAKARASQAVNAGRMSPGEKAKIDAKADDFPALFSLEDVRRGLVVLCKAAGEAKTHRGGAANLCTAFGSAERVFISEAAKVYVKYARRKAAISRPDRKTITGPFVRFIQEASRQFCEGAPPPSPETIKKALAGPRHGYGAS
jgi:hypothetical protein